MCPFEYSNENVPHIADCLKAKGAKTVWQITPNRKQNPCLKRYKKPGLNISQYLYIKLTYFGIDVTTFCDKKVLVKYDTSSE